MVHKLEKKKDPVQSNSIIEIYGVIIIIKLWNTAYYKAIEYGIESYK